MFEHHTQIYLHYTDAAGRLFFANQFVLVQETLEKFLSYLGLPVHDIINHPMLSLPIVHAESDYKSILKVGDQVVILASVENVGDTSVTFSFIIKKSDGTVAGTSRIVSVLIDKGSVQKVPIPAEWRSKLLSDG